MKNTILFFLAAILFFKSNAQVEDTTHVTITLKAKQHAYIIAFMGDKGQPACINYMNQVADQITDTADHEKPIAVTVGESLVTQLFITIGSQQERLTAVYNNDIKQALIPQLMAYPRLLSAIQVIAAGNAAETENMVRYGFGFLQRIK